MPDEGMETMKSTAGLSVLLPGTQIEQREEEASPTRVLSCSLGHANNLPLMLRAENTDTSLGFRICFSVKRSRETDLRSLTFQCESKNDQCRKRLTPADL